jgi:two-component system CheB/CheR fusion protein
MAPDRHMEALDGVDGDARLREHAFEASPSALVVLDNEGTVVQLSQAARSMFQLGVQDIGRRLQDLEVSYRPLELRSRLEQAQKERRTVVVSGVDRHFEDGRIQYLDVMVMPLFDDDGTHLGAQVAFTDVTSEQGLRTELERTKQERETAYEELQSTNEELETTNEELQSTVEELETTNEELQSANEELETMNEELQSTNGELQTINVEMRERSLELDRLNSFMESVLTSLRVGVAVLDPEGRVQIWNSCAEDMWGLRSDEVVGQSLFALDIGLPVGQLAAPVRRCASGESDGDDIVLEALNRRGRTISCRVSLAPLVEGRQREGVVMLMEAGEAVAAPS